MPDNVIRILNFHSGTMRSCFSV